MSEESLSDLLERSADRHAVGALPLERMLARSRAARTRRAGLMALAASVVVGSLIAGTTLLFSPDDPHPPISTPPVVHPTPDAVDLEGDWIVVALFNADWRSEWSQRRTPLPGSAGKIRVTFKAGKMAETAGCTFAHARYTQSGVLGQDLIFGAATTSSLLCLNSDPRLTPRLPDVRHVSESNGILYLRAKNRLIIATLERVGRTGLPRSVRTTTPTTSQVLGRWDVVSVNGHEPPADAIRRIRMGKDRGRFYASWSDGVNDHSLEWSFERGSFKQGGGATTLVLCRSSAGDPCERPSGFGVEDATALRLTQDGKLLFLGPVGEELATYERVTKR